MFFTRILSRSRSGLGIMLFKVFSEHGAFSLCTPSLGSFVTKLTLRFLFWANVIHMITPPLIRIQTLAGLQHSILYGGAGCDVELIVQFQYALIYGLNVLDGF